MNARRLIHEFFSDADLDAIRAAAHRAEQHTAGELVSYAVGRCDRYAWSRGRAALSGALAGSLLASALLLWPELWPRWLDPWGLGHPTLWMWMALPPLAGAFTGWVLGGYPWVLRRLATSDEIAVAVSRRAAAAFLEEEIFATRERTGVLIFLALFERRAVLLADKGLNDRIAESRWQEIADQLTAEIAAGNARSALLESIQACERLLVESGVERRDDDIDELANELRLRDE